MNQGLFNVTDKIEELGWKLKLIEFYLKYVLSKILNCDQMLSFQVKLAT
jgi:hypothetical protein